MKHTLYLWSLLLVAMFAISCEKEITFDGNEQSPLLVLNGIVSPDTSVWVTVQRSQFFLSNNRSYTLGTTAKVALFVNDVFVENLLPTDEKTYHGTYVPKTGDVIRVDVSAAGYPSVSATTTIPEPPKVKYKSEENTSKWVDAEVYHNDVIIVGRKRMQTNTVIYELDDDAQRGDAYFFAQRSEGVDYEGKYSIQHFPEPIRTVMPGLGMSKQSMSMFEILMGESISQDDGPIINVVSDDLFNGRKVDTRFNVEFTTETDLTDPAYTAEPEQLTYTFCVGSMSPEYYEFLVSITKAYNNEGEMVSEPVQITSNVQGGIGLLGAYNRTLVDYSVEYMYIKRDYNYLP